MKTKPCKAKLHNVFHKLKQKNLIKLNMINCILLGLLLLVSMVHLKCTYSPLVIRFLNSIRLFRLYVLLVLTLPVCIVVFFHLQFLMITLPNIFSSVSQNLSKQFLVSCDVTSVFTNIPLEETIDITPNLIFNHNPNLNLTRK